MCDTCSCTSAYDTKKCEMRCTKREQTLCPYPVHLRHVAVLHGRREIGHLFLNVGLFVRDALLSVLEHLVLGGQILDGVGLVRDDLSSHATEPRESRYWQQDKNVMRRVGWTNLNRPNMRWSKNAKPSCACCALIILIQYHSSAAHVNLF
jgi:hypothetical protein